MSDYEDAICPNCVTPWKCNGPHDADSSICWACGLLVNHATGHDCTAVDD